MFETIVVKTYFLICNVCMIMKIYFVSNRKVVRKSIKLVLFLFEGSVILTEHGLALHW